MYKLLPYLLFLFAPSITFGQQGTTIKNGTAFISYKTFGKGKPLLIINGGPGMNSEGFDGIAKMLSKNNMTITYDQRGTGRSTLQQTDTSTITMDLMVEDIEVLRKHLKIDQWIIMGHSFGGMLASYYATIHPGNIESLILSSSGGIDLGLLSNVSSGINSKLTGAELDAAAYWNNRIATGDTSHYARLQRGMALAPAYVYNRKYIPIIAERLTQGNPIINGLVWNDLHKIKFDCTKKLASFDKPVLIIQGKDDIIEEKTAIKAHKAFKNSSVVLLDHSRHYGWLDNEEVYLSAIAKFLGNKN